MMHTYTPNQCPYQVSTSTPYRIQEPAKDFQTHGQSVFALERDFASLYTLWGELL